MVSVSEGIGDKIQQNTAKYKIAVERKFKSRFFLFGPRRLRVLFEKSANVKIDASKTAKIQKFRAKSKQNPAKSCKIRNLAETQQNPAKSPQNPANWQKPPKTQRKT